MRAEGRSFTKYERSVRQHLRTGGIATLHPVRVGGGRQRSSKGVGRGWGWQASWRNRLLKDRNRRGEHVHAGGQESAVKVKPAVKDRSPPQFWLSEALQLYDPPSRAGNAGGGLVVTLAVQPRAVCMMWAQLMAVLEYTSVSCECESSSYRPSCECESSIPRPAVTGRAAGVSCAWETE